MNRATRTAERPTARRLGLIAGAMLGALTLAGCQVSELAGGAHLAPVPSALERKIERLNMPKRAPILVRIFKQESQLEVWKRNRSGRYALLKTYEICAWSGELGPKMKEGDRQAPEGFYKVGPGQMNPNSSYHLAFNIGFPNAFDRSHDRTGSHLMVHGDCSSRGCYAMEDAQIQEIYALAREAFRGGQSAFQIQAFPFRMTPENMAEHRESENFAFWEMLKRGSDHFEVTRHAPQVDVCGQAYVFNASAEGGTFEPRRACPAYSIPQDIATQVEKKHAADLEKRRALIARDMRREQRKDRFEDRDEAIASFFDRSRDEGAATNAQGDVDPTDVQAAAVAAAVPVPRGVPQSVTRTSEPTAAAARPAPVASIAGANASADPAPRAPVASIAAPDRQRQPAAEQPRDVGEPAAFGYAPAPAEDDRGILSSVAKGGRGLFRAAGSLFD